MRKRQRKKNHKKFVDDMSRRLARTIIDSFDDFMNGLSRLIKRRAAESLNSVDIHRQNTADN